MYSKFTVKLISINKDLPQTVIFTRGCARFAAILLARSHHQFFHRRCWFISHRLFIVESCNFCHVGDRFVGAPLKNVKISANRAHPCVLHASFSFFRFVKFVKFFEILVFFFKNTGTRVNFEFYTCTYNLNIPVLITACITY